MSEPRYLLRILFTGHFFQQQVKSFVAIKLSHLVTIKSDHWFLLQIDDKNCNCGHYC